MDDLDFSFDITDNTPEPEIAPAPEPAPAAPTIDPQALKAIEEKLAATERFQQALGQAFGQPQPQADPVQQQLEQLAQQLAPKLQPLIQQQLEQTQVQKEAQALTYEFRQNHPNLVPFEKGIYAEVDDLFTQSLQQGKPLSLRQAYEQTVQKYQSGLLASATSAGPTLKTQPIPFTVSNGQGQPPAGPVDFSTMSDADFAKYSAARQRKLGINPI